MHISRFQDMDFLAVKDALSLPSGEFSSAEENLKYFEEFKPQNWFCALDNDEQPVGFVISRYDSELMHDLEIFVKDSLDRNAVLLALLGRFNVVSAELYPDYKFRISVVKKDKILNSVIQKIFVIDSKSEFLLMEKDLVGHLSGRSIKEHASSEEISQILDLFAGVKQYTQEEIQKLVGQKKIFWIKHNEKIAAAVHFEDRPEVACELITMVTSDELRGEGFATRLLELLKHEFKGRYAKMFVKVNSINQPGISLCCNAGLLSNPNKIETQYICTIA